MSIKWKKGPYVEKIAFNGKEEPADVWNCGVKPVSEVDSSNDEGGADKVGETVKIGNKGKGKWYA